MKKPIVGFETEVAWGFFLTKEITLYGRKTFTPHPRFDDVYLDVFFEDVFVGELTKGMCQRLFDVILYPPGSEPSPESADPEKKHRMQLEEERQYDIPRKDILDNGDWN